MTFLRKSTVHVWVNKIWSLKDTENLFRYSESSLNSLSGVCPRIFYSLPPSPLKIDPKMGYFDLWKHCFFKEMALIGPQGPIFGSRFFFKKVPKFIWENDKKIIFPIFLTLVTKLWKEVVEITHYFDLFLAKMMKIDLNEALNCDKNEIWTCGFLQKHRIYEIYHLKK